MTKNRKAGLDLLRAALVGLSSDEFNSPAASKARAANAARRARVRSMLAVEALVEVAAAPKDVGQDLVAQTLRRSEATKRAHKKRPASVAMGEIERDHFPPWYRKHAKADGRLPRGLHESFAQEMVDLFKKREPPVKIGTGGIVNNIPRWVASLRATTRSR